MTSHIRPSAAFAVAAFLVLTGCAGDGGAGGDAGAPAPPPTATADGSDSSGGSTPSGPTTAAPTSGDATTQNLDQAVAALITAAEAAPNGRSFDLERDTHQGQPIWEVQVAADGQELEVKVSEDGASVVAQEGDDDLDEGDRRKLEAASIEAVDALRTAHEQRGGIVTELEIDDLRDGTVVWQVDLRQPDGSVVEVLVDASTGQVIN